MYDPIETELVVALAGGRGCSLETKKGDSDNWIERAGGRLPTYICKVAKGIMKSGRSKSSAIAMAISQIKKWAAGGEDVNADTRAKAAKALAQWEALKAKAKGKKVVKASNGQADYLFLSVASDFNTAIVRRAWEAIAEKIARQSDETDETDAPTPAYHYPYIDELWVTHLIVEHMNAYFRVDYVVRADGDVEFGPMVQVEKTWTEVEDDEDDLTDDEIAAILSLSAPVGTPLGKILSLYSKE